MTEEPTQPTDLEPIQSMLIGPNYEVCCLGKGKKQAIVYSSDSLEKFEGVVALQEWAKTAELWIEKKKVEYAYGHLNNIQPGILNKEKKIKEENGFVVYGLSGSEFFNFARRLKEYLGNKKDQILSQVTQFPTEKPEIYSKKNLPEIVKERSRILGRKRKNQGFVPRRFLTNTWKQ